MTDTHLRPDLTLSAVPRYVQLASLFRSRIGSGTWPIGGQIPTVDDLVDECGVARATIRQALGLLEGDGLIKRYRAKGTFVERSPNEQIWCEVQTNWSGLLMSREGAKIEVLSDTAKASPPDIAIDYGELAPAYRHLRRRHSREGKTYLIADVYVDERLRKLIPAAAFRTETAMKLIANRPGHEITDARQTLTIGSADVETAQQLGVPLNLPVAFVNRVAVDDKGQVVLIAKGIYRGDVVHLDMRLK